MEKERKIKILSLVAMIVAVLGLTVAFAALSQTLTINGTASVNAAEWDIHFENVGNEETYGDATLTLPTLTGTKLSNYAISITKPGDYASFEFDIVNAGTIDAKINNIDLGSKYQACLKDSSDESCLLFDFNGDGRINAADTTTYNIMFNYRLEYADTDKSLAKNDIIKVGESKRVRLVVEYFENANTLLKTATKLVDGNTTIDFVQVD